MRIKLRKNFRQLLQYLHRVIKPKKGKGSFKRKKRIPHGQEEN